MLFPAGSPALLRTRAPPHKDTRRLPLAARPASMPTAGAGRNAPSPARGSIDPRRLAHSPTIPSALAIHAFTPAFIPIFIQASLAAVPPAHHRRAHSRAHRLGPIPRQSLVGTPRRRTGRARSSPRLHRHPLAGTNQHPASRFACPRPTVPNDRRAPGTPPDTLSPLRCPHHGGRGRRLSAQNLGPY